MDILAVLTLIYGLTTLGCRVMAPSLWRSLLPDDFSPNVDLWVNTIMPLALATAFLIF